VDNPSRSKRTREAVVAATLEVVARDGTGRLTLDAIAQQANMSKGAIMHHFQSKEAVLEAVVDQYVEHFDEFTRGSMAGNARRGKTYLQTQIACWHDALAKQRPIAFAVLAAMALNPNISRKMRVSSAVELDELKAEAADPELATLRWAAARGLGVTALLGMCPLPGDERERLFERLIDDERWRAFSNSDRETDRDRDVPTGKAAKAKAAGRRARKSAKKRDKGKESK
jgi:AcrR family transcriptional regulator